MFTSGSHSKIYKQYLKFVPLKELFLEFPNDLSKTVYSIKCFSNVILYISGNF